MKANFDLFRWLGTFGLVILLVGFSLLTTSCSTTAVENREKSVFVKISLPGAHPEFLKREYVVPIERKIFGLGIASRLRSNAAESEARIEIHLSRRLTVSYGEDQIRRIISELFADTDVEELAIEVFTNNETK